MLILGTFAVEQIIIPTYGVNNGDNGCVNGFVGAIDNMAGGTASAYQYPLILSCTNRIRSHFVVG